MTTQIRTGRSDLEPRVRAAARSDLAELVRLAELARSHAAGERGGSVHLGSGWRSDPLERSLAEDLDRDDRRVLLGTVGDSVFGYAVVSDTETVDGRLAVVSDLFVEVGARGVGLGRLLMQHCIDWARKRGCSGVDSVALPGDRETKNFFEALGLVARLITVHRSLEPDPAADASVADASGPQGTTSAPERT